MHSKLALITGASKGIGRAVAKLAVQHGMHVIAAGRDENDLRKLQTESDEKEGQLQSLSAELTDSNSRKLLAHAVEEKSQKLDLLVHSAGIACVGSVREINENDWRAILEVNLTVPFLLTRELLPFMQRGSHIIFINSVAGRVTFPDWSAYCASKYGLRALADTLRMELDSNGIKVTTIYPASVDTPMQDQLPYDWDRSKMLKAGDVARAVWHCFSQPENVLIKELDVENYSGTF